eukprot:COSAG04_NODE_730_length_10737_cov_31.931002_18_plen_82_part_00
MQVMTDRWFKEWMYQVAVDVEMLPADVAAILDQTPTVLPAWDPMVRPHLCFRDDLEADGCVLDQGSLAQTLPESGDVAAKL